MGVLSEIFAAVPSSYLPGPPVPSGTFPHSVDDATVCDLETVYVPTPPVAVPRAVTKVPKATPGPESTVPTVITPEVTEVTESVVVV